MYFIWYILIGILAGFIAGKIMRGGGFGILINLLVGIIGGLLGGSMITESVFSVPGIGSYALTAINNRDYVAIQGYVLFTGCAFVLVCLAADLLCACLNPQIRLGAET